MAGFVLMVIYTITGLAISFALFKPSSLILLLTEFQALPRYLVHRIRWTSIGTVTNTPRLGLKKKDKAAWSY